MNTTENKKIKNVVILGGDASAWLTAGLIAAEHRSWAERKISITLIEHPSLQTMGLGESTWPSIRKTLSKMGISETTLIKECEASFKQGSRFTQWVNGRSDDSYYHPMDLPIAFHDTNLALPWQAIRNSIPYSDAVCFQGVLSHASKAPKHINTPEYACIANYAYHLNSEKFTRLLKNHCCRKLGVRHIEDQMTAVKSTHDGDIAALATKHNGEIHGDLFIDCSGLHSLLLGQHYRTQFISKKHILLNDTILTTQVPYQSEDSPIASNTIFSARKNGWIWDRGLANNHCLGSVYSSAHCSSQAAEAELSNYIESLVNSEQTKMQDFKKTSINQGYYAKPWHRNCVAVGTAAGIAEPLEPSALTLVETFASMISKELPSNRALMDIVAKRYNQLFLYHWSTLIEFLKLHYVISQRRDSSYWNDHLQTDSIPQHLQDQLELWRHQVPNKNDYPMKEEIIPLASWQYILYGMGFKTHGHRKLMGSHELYVAEKYFKKINQFSRKRLNQLPDNRDLLNKIYQQGLRII